MGNVVYPDYIYTIKHTLILTVTNQVLIQKNCILREYMILDEGIYESLNHSLIFMQG